MSTSIGANPIRSLSLSKEYGRSAERSCSACCSKLVGAHPIAATQLKHFSKMPLVFICSANWTPVEPGRTLRVKVTSISKGFNDIGLLCQLVEYPALDLGEVENY
jgi:hypothetical protein